MRLPMLLLAAWLALLLTWGVLSSGCTELATRRYVFSDCVFRGLEDGEEIWLCARPIRR